MRFDVVERFVADAAGERCVAGHHHDVFVTAAQIAADRHAERSGERRAGVTGAVAIVFAFRAQEKTVEPAELSHRVETVETPGKHFVHVALVTHVHHEAVTRRVEDAMQAQSSAPPHRGLGRDVRPFGKGP